MKPVHPVLQQRAFVLQAAPLRDFKATFMRLLQNGELSLCAYGVPRVGKTTAGHYLRQHLEERRIAACRIASFEKQQGPKIDRAEFWRRFMGDSLLAFSSKWTTPASARNALLTALMVEADERATKNIVLGVDEGQYLNVQQFSMLKQFIEDLIVLKMNPFLLLLAQPEIQARPAELLRHNYHDLVDRFFIHWHRFRGLVPSEFEAVLAHYDQAAWAPEADRAPVSFTGYFSPELAGAGGLKSLAPYFVSAFQRANTDLGGPKPEEFETKFLVTAVRVFLLSIRGHPQRIGPKSVAEYVQSAVKCSGIYENRRSVGNALILARPTGKKWGREQ